jgi:hypothetical protein
VSTKTILARPGYDFAADQRLTVLTCGVCSIVHAIPNQLYDRCQERDEHWYCPNGHYLHFIETEADKQRHRAERAEQDARWARQQRDAARQLAETERRSAIAYKGHLTRIRKRIANGVCPVPGCKRSGFDRVLAHIASQHPDWLHAHPEITEHA